MGSGTRTEDRGGGEGGRGGRGSGGGLAAAGVGEGVDFMRLMWSMSWREPLPLRMVPVAPPSTTTALSAICEALKLRVTALSLE
eukprot:218939-Rhodomonas_salina.1